MLFLHRKEFSITERKGVNDDFSFHHRIIFKYNTTDKAKADFVVRKLNEIMIGVKQIEEKL